MKSIYKKYGVHPPFHGIHLKKVWNPSPSPCNPSPISLNLSTKSMESIPQSMESILKKYGVHPPVHGIHPPFHGFHMDYPREGKVQPYGFHGSKFRG